MFFDPLPTQNFLVHLLTVFSIILRKVQLRFASQQLQIAGQILEAVVLIPVSKDVSPFLIPAAHEESMTSVQTLVLTSLAILFTDEKVLDRPDADNSVESSGNLFRKSEITNLHRSLEIHLERPLVQLYPAIINQLLSFSQLGWAEPNLLSLPSAVNLSVARLPVVIVNYSSFALSSLVLAVQLCRACVSHDLDVTLTVVERFIQVWAPPPPPPHPLPLPSPPFVLSLSTFLSSSSPPLIPPTPTPSLLLLLSSPSSSSPLLSPSHSSSFSSSSSSSSSSSLFSSFSFSYPFLPLLLLPDFA